MTGTGPRPCRSNPQGRWCPKVACQASLLMHVRLLWAMPSAVAVARPNEGLLWEHPKIWGRRLLHSSVARSCVAAVWSKGPFSCCCSCDITAHQNLVDFKITKPTSWSYTSRFLFLCQLFFCGRLGIQWSTYDVLYESNHCMPMATVCRSSKKGLQKTMMI